MERLIHMRGPHWLALYTVIVAAWVGVWAMTAPQGANWFADLCRAAVGEVGFGAAFAMWLLMSAAMMLPTALPTFASHDMIPGARGGGRLVAGYAVVWVLFSAGAAALQTGLSRIGVLDTDGAVGPAIAVALLLLAAAYQLSPLKEACLSKCRQPLTFLMQHWAEGPWRMGLRLGAVCLGCCWALMALGFVGGTMSLGFMALATILMTFEKLSAGPWVSRGIALACLMGAGFLIGGLT